MFFMYVCKCSSCLQQCKNYNKTSAVAEMGDRGHNRHGPKRGGLLCSFRRGEGELGLRLTLTQCDLGRGLLPYKVACLSIQPFGHKTGGCARFRGS